MKHLIYQKVHNNQVENNQKIVLLEIELQLVIQEQEKDYILNC